VNRPVALIVPPVADHVTAVLFVPVTVAVNCCVPPMLMVNTVGEIATVTGALTVTVADADCAGSAALVAVTVYVPGALGAVYSPSGEMVPPVADQVTAVMSEPVIIAVNCCVPPGNNDAAVGDTDTVTGGAATALLPNAETRHRLYD
jgi:hypothetical protein